MSLFAKLTDPALSQVDKEQNFRGLFREGFDLPAISRFVLGRYWRRADTAQRDAFLEAFEELHMRRFLPMFAEFSEKSISITKVQRGHHGATDRQHCIRLLIIHAARYTNAVMKKVPRFVPRPLPGAGHQR